MSEYDEEPRIHTVISPDSTNSNAFFNSIAFSIPRREDSNVAPPLPSADNQQHPTQANAYNDNSVRISAAVNYDEMSMSLLADDLQSGDHLLEINAQQNTSPPNHYQGEQQRLEGSGNQQNDSQSFYNTPSSQSTYTYENQQQPTFYENLNQLPLEYNYQPQSHQILYDNPPTHVIPFENPQVPLDQSQQVPVSYINQSQLSYESHPQHPEMSFNNQQSQPQQLAYESQQIVYTDPQNAYLDQMQFSRQDPPISQLNYDGQNQIAYSNQPQGYISNPNEVLYNSQQAQLTYQNESQSQSNFENQMQSRSLMQSPVYSETIAAAEETGVRHYGEVASNAEANIVKKLENLELGVEAGLEAQEPTSCSYSNEKQPQPSEVYYGSTLPVGDLLYPQDVPIPQDPQTLEMYPDATQIDGFSVPTYTGDDSLYDKWIPSEETRNILKNNSEAVRAGTFPEKSHMTAPGVIYADDLVDKVGVNMARIFGEAEACKRKILTADSVTQDDNGLRELIKLGCYRSAINLTKRLLTLYGQGPGKVGHYSKQTPHSLQLWFTRISLLMRIREFSIAESEIAAFKNFDNPDMFYEYYPDTYGSGRTGSMVPFHFRLLAAEVPQYVRKFNETANGLNQILLTINKISEIIENDEDCQESVKRRDRDSNENADVMESGNPDKNNKSSEIEKGVDPVEQENKEKALAIWKKREIRTLYALVNASLFSKDYYNAFTLLIKLCEKDSDHRPQIKSAIGRLFLQHGDLTTAQNYFLEAADLRSGESEADQVETLIDSALTSIAQNAYPEAFLLFQQALQIQPENFMVTNNMAVCLLYMGNVKDALALMESTVKQNTPQLLQENVILNLSTIYELENSDGYKKNALLKLISQYKGDGINLASLKMPNLI